jgi:hypothetical protein
LKKFFLFILFLSQISFAGEALNGLEAMFLKISSELFFSDYENEKNITHSNKNKIKEIDKKLILLDKNMKLLNADLVEVKRLKDKLNFKLKEISNDRVKKLKINIHNIRNKNSDKLRVAVDIARIRELPFKNSKILGILNREDIIEIKECNGYNWCKLKSKNGYIARYLLKELN